jgi:endogenous inhibitor of DNA gyrase (YacG/DUF329 family)
MKAPLVRTQAQVHCPMCTHTVPAAVNIVAKRTKVAPGQKCPRCQASLDAAAVVFIREAA